MVVTVDYDAFLYRVTEILRGHLPFKIGSCDNLHCNSEIVCTTSINGI
jgi:hypothetical protein